jgi:hypothetical protein
MATGDMAYQAGLFDDNNIAIATGTDRGTDENVGSDQYSGGIGTNTGTGNVTIGWTASPNTYGFRMHSVRVIDAGVAGGAPPKQRGFKTGAALGTVGIGVGGQIP